VPKIQLGLQSLNDVYMYILISLMGYDMAAPPGWSGLYFFGLIVMFFIWS